MSRRRATISDGMPSTCDGFVAGAFTRTRRSWRREHSRMSASNSSSASLAAPSTGAAARRTSSASSRTAVDAGLRGARDDADVRGRPRSRLRPRTADSDSARGSCARPRRVERPSGGRRRCVSLPRPVQQDLLLAVAVLSCSRTNSRALYERLDRSPRAMPSTSRRRSSGSSISRWISSRRPCAFWSNRSARPCASRTISLDSFCAVLLDFVREPLRRQHRVAQVLFVLAVLGRGAPPCA